jgi:tagatose-1,6-bisphosphate aldolase non-catalytic subunit AgaZ/GatZ
MDFDPGKQAAELRQNSRQQHEARLVHAVSDAVQQDGMEAGVTEEDFERTLRGWIAAENGINLLPDRSEHGA